MTAVPAEFEAYARAATAGIDGRRERLDAQAELIEHLLASLDEEITAGADRRSAIVAVLERMGDAADVAEPIGLAHTPRWTLGAVLKLVGAATLVFFAIWLGFWLASYIYWN